MPRETVTVEIDEALYESVVEGFGKNVVKSDNFSLILLCMTSKLTALDMCVDVEIANPKHGESKDFAEAMKGLIRLDGEDTTRALLASEYVHNAMRLRKKESQEAAANDIMSQVRDAEKRG